MSKRTCSRNRAGFAAGVSIVLCAHVLVGCGDTETGDKSSTGEADLTQPVLHRIGANMESPAMVSAMSVASLTTAAAAAALPASVDLTAELPPVGDQGGQGSCVGWAVGYSTKTLQEVVESRWPPDATDHEFSPSWIYNQINGGHDRGSSVSDALNLLVSKGDDTMSSFPYNQSDFTTQPSAASLARAAHYKALSWNMPAVSATNLKTTLAGGNAVIVAFQVLPDMDAMDGTTNTVYDTDVGSRKTFTFSPCGTNCGGECNGPGQCGTCNTSTNVCTVPACTSNCSRGGHAVAIVGYDDNAQTFTFINQWGAGWNGNGYGRMAYSFVTNAHLGMQAFVLVDKANVPGLQDSTMTWEETAPLLLI